MVKRELEAQATVVSGGGHPDRVRIVLRVPESGAVAIEAVFTFQQWGEFLAVGRMTRCAGAINTHPSLIGTREIKTETVALPKGALEDVELMMMAEAYNVEGWHARWRDLRNSHNGPPEARRLHCSRYLDGEGRPLPHPHADGAYD
jgi:hypothetical protein